MIRRTSAATSIVGADEAVNRIVAENERRRGEASVVESLRHSGETARTSFDTLLASAPQSFRCKGSSSAFATVAVYCQYKQEQQRGVLRELRDGVRQREYSHWEDKAALSSVATLTS